MLLDHWSRCDNTTVHVALKLIPRFVTSQPFAFLYPICEVERTIEKCILAVTAISVRQLRDSFTP